MSATHVHVIDGKSLTYPNQQCPICNPQQTQQQSSGTGASAYTKGGTVVLKFSKASLLTINFWRDKGTFLVSMSEIARNAQNQLMRDGNNKPIWNKMTRRASAEVLKTFIYELSALIQNIEGKSNVPKRD